MNISCYYQILVILIILSLVQFLTIYAGRAMGGKFRSADETEAAGCVQSRGSTDSDQLTRIS